MTWLEENGWVETGFKIWEHDCYPDHAYQLCFEDGFVWVTKFNFAMENKCMSVSLKTYLQCADHTQKSQATPTQ